MCLLSCSFDVYIGSHCLHACGKNNIIIQSIMIFMSKGSSVVGACTDITILHSMSSLACMCCNNRLHGTMCSKVPVKIIIIFINVHWTERITAVILMVMQNSIVFSSLVYCVYTVS